MLLENMRFARCLLTASISLAGVSCHTAPTPGQLDGDNPIQPPAPAPYGMEEFFAAASHQPEPSRVRLGRWLFYDTRLSKDSAVSCASCHRSEYAFSEPLAVAKGIGGQAGRRKTPSLINLGARTVLPGTTRDPGETFFWDGRATSLETQALAPIADPREMGFTHAAMIDRFAAIPGYAPYFKEAFGSPSITADRIAEALADFVRTRRSGNAAYDRWAYGRDAHAMSLEAQRGGDLFFSSANCTSCHAGFNFSDGLFHNLGVGWNPATQTFADVGRMAVSHDTRDLGAFKTPGLREVDKHGPYMHDGSLATLRDVVDFYNRGGQKNPGLSARLRPLRLSDADANALVAFLQALSGEGFQDRPPRYFPQ